MKYSVSKDEKELALMYLQEHTKRFTKRVEKVTENIYCAVGYGLANSTLIVTDAGNIIVDTTEGIETAAEVKKEFDKISPLPTIAVIYTHGHPDHINGASVFADDKTEIYANKLTLDFIQTQYNQLNSILEIRGARQFGVFLQPEHYPYSGLGPALKLSGTKKIMVPTTVFEDAVKLQFGSTVIQLVSAPGETEDQIFIWLPEEKVLLGADNYYPAFPNLYTIRGTSPRPVLQWVYSLDKMRALQAEYLVLGHTEPVYGKEKIAELLTIYRDGIQYIHDSTVRGMNAGKTVDELVEEISLPESLASYEELRELYGSISQSVRAIYSGYLGWFDGNASNLEQLSSRAFAQKMADLAGGNNRLLKEATNAVENGEFQWAAQLADMLLSLLPENDQALQVKIRALTELGLRSYNSNNRSYYLSQAKELQNGVPFLNNRSNHSAYAYAEKMPIRAFFQQMTILLQPEKCEHRALSLSLTITDDQKQHILVIRNGIIDIQEGCLTNPDITVATSSSIWKEIILGILNPNDAANNAGFQLTGDAVSFSQFVGFFQK
ncbi:MULTISPECIES: alkyl sulfatase dimerization domain-containing protein [unclassified Niallia]|uniref:alkyl sulfatase dimerization domain-containing protein n=1 Tax=unclassified Niallia TaxID=2837522 RepID=UPI001EDC88A0|nr:MULTISPECIES: alkyl sulfatase dimerization domain-containing protein [unclassified Niallia]MDL0434706.1 alkyl sulfatase dimerization domain-containing protein [Niallia sp. SS-2023]UPO85978.1 MBL fold metallo-hydrolase [Niallia sp. Man26]